MTKAARAAGLAVPAQLHGWRLAVVRAAWMLAAVGIVALVTVGFVRAFRDPGIGELATVTALLDALGLDVRIMMAFALVVPFVVVVIVNAVVFAHSSHDPRALMFVLVVLVLFAFSSRSLLAFEGVPLLRHAHAAAFAATIIGVTAVLALFPDGRFVPRSARWLVVLAVGMVVAFPDASRLIDGVDAGHVSGRTRLLSLAITALILFGARAQVQRYRHASGPVERQQTKWVMSPLCLWLVLVLVGGVPVVLFGVDERWLGWIVLFAVLPLGVFFPIAVGVALLRYRLYEIDRILSRTLSYGLVVGVLGAVYAAVAVGFGAAASALAGPDQSGLVVAASVLAVVVLFRPVRARAQRTVDRRFNRTGYEARRAAASFPHALRDHVELDGIRSELAATVDRTVQPTHVSVWLAPRQRPRAGASSAGAEARVRGLRQPARTASRGT